MRFWVGIYETATHKLIEALPVEAPTFIEGMKEVRSVRGVRAVHQYLKAGNREPTF